MTALRQFAALVLWDFRRELRRGHSVLSMVLFAILALFLVHLGIGPLFSRLAAIPGDPFLPTLIHRVGAVILWVTVLFAGTVGLSQAFDPREGDSLSGVLLAPVDLGLFYLAKVFAVWVYVVLTELCLLAGYVLLFGYEDWSALPEMVLSLALFTIGFVALGIVLAAMTAALRGGSEVVLRIVLFPLLMPIVYLTMSVKEATLGLDINAGAAGSTTGFGRYVALLSAFDAIYLATGFLVFPKVFDE